MSIQETVLKIKGAGDLSRVILECALLGVLLIMGFVLWLFWTHPHPATPITTVVTPVTTVPIKLEISKQDHPQPPLRPAGTSPYKGEDTAPIDTSSKNKE